jgi:uncharacterized protein YdiU (UPF0061 family)
MPSPDAYCVAPALRSSVRELLACEALHALGVPTTRALALVLLPAVSGQRSAVSGGCCALGISGDL